MSDFILCKWRAWAPGLSAGDDRLMGPGNTVVPECVPKMLRRGLTPLAKAVFSVAGQCVEGGAKLPVVFSSAHNTIAGRFSIAYRNNQEITVIAPGEEGITPVFIEALGMLHEGADDVLIILYDESIADFYPIAPFNLNAAFPCVLALRIALSGLPLQIFHRAESRDDGEYPVQLLMFLRFLLAEEQSLSLGSQGHSWTWHKK